PRSSRQRARRRAFSGPHSGRRKWSMSEADRWLEQARRDLDDTRYAAAGSRWKLACFLAQQAAVKASKAYLYSRGAEAVWGHSVAELCQEASEHDASRLLAPRPPRSTSTTSRRGTRTGCQAGFPQRPTRGTTRSVRSRAPAR